MRRKKLLLLATLSTGLAAFSQTAHYPEMILVEGGTFEMGDEHGLGKSVEQPVHSVTLKTFSIAKTETTVLQWKTYCQETGRNMQELPEWPSGWTWKDDHPMVNVSWQDAVAYCDWLSDKTGNLYRLPTEAEWEYAARGGNKSIGYTCSGGNDMDQLGWYNDNAAGQTITVGRKKPNELGIYDMSGNVWEWCKDWYSAEYYATSPKDNPKGPTSGFVRVLRGGSWFYSAAACRVAYRFNYFASIPNSDAGFRVVLFATAQTPASIPDKPEVVLVQGGTFTIGSNAADASSDENPTHSVMVSTFSIGKYEVTWGQYKAFCTSTGRPVPTTPDWGINDKHPVVNVNYNDCMAYCNWLGETHGGDWRLPTEAEWEYTARGGNKSMGYTYSGGNDMDQLGWYNDNAAGQTIAVGRKKPNELGIYDMSGNVWEWCMDWYSDSYYASSPASNPRGPSSGSFRVLRGGSWNISASYCRVAFRGNIDPSLRGSSLGFRVVLSQ